MAGAPEQPASRRPPKRGELPPAEAYAPAHWDLHHLVAIQALNKGTATPEQQKFALDWIRYHAGLENDLSYRPGPGGDRDTAFAEGRRFVATQIRKMLQLNPAHFQKKEPKDG